jgi:sarcosine oxidase subunit alpha
MAARRLPTPLHPGAVRGRPVRFTVDGTTVEGFEGEPVAAALLAAGRPVLSRSFRFHRPRGLMCSTGQCGWCECRVDGRPSVRSCRVPVRDGLAVEGEHALPSVRRDVLGLLDLGSRLVPPTFYHHRFLRPRRLRKRYLDVIRWFGGRGRLEPGAPVPSPREVRRVAVDVAVIGGGPAGLLAAEAAAAAGATVLIIEADEAVGGPWRWRDEALPDGGSLDELVARLERDERVTVATGTTVVGVYGEVVQAIGADALLDVHARSVVVASGSYEQLPLVPGNDRPGVMGARAVEWLIRAHGILPGATAAIVGDGPDARRAAAAIGEAGGTVVATLEPDALVAIEGRDRVRAIRHRADGRTTRTALDLVVVALRTPSIELARAAPEAHVAGAAAGRPIEDAAAVDAAREVGRTAATTSGSARASAPPALASRGAVPAGAMVCFCEDVRGGEIAHERRLGYADPELVKRRTGALTGPCQGKYCAPGFCAAMGMTEPSLPTTRPPARPVRLGELVRDEVLLAPTDQNPS